MADEGAARTDLRGFLIVNSSELVERLAYYGVLSVNGLYLLSLGFGGLVVGLVSAILLALPYIVPLVAGPLAERTGYKPVMLLAFVFYAAGFLLIAIAPTAWGFVGGAVLVGTGAGMFKPLTAASIAHVTSPEHRTFGYSVYYVGINVGGFIGPILMTVFGGHYRAAYLVGAATIGVDFLLILALFRNPLPPRLGLRVLDAFRPLFEILSSGVVYFIGLFTPITESDRAKARSNVRFLVLLGIFSGFWFVYSMALTFLIPYLQAYVELPPWFKPNLQVALESLCVIVLGIPLGGLASKRDGVRMMTLGIVLLVLGFVVIGFLPSFVPYVLGIVLVASGEVLAYPGFLSYVSRISPRDRVAVYQGLGFLPLFVGFLVGPIVGGQLYASLVVHSRHPVLFWALMDAVGVATLAAFLLYARALRPVGTAGPWWQGRAAAAGVVVLGVVLVVSGIAAGSTVPLPPSLGAKPPQTHFPDGATLATLDGTATEAQTVKRTIVLPANYTSGDNLTFVLTWTDEPPGSPLPGASNQPDTFTLGVAFNDMSGRGASAHASNPPGGQGSIVLPIRGLHPGKVDLTIDVTAGDTTFGGQTVAADPGNSWSLKVVAGTVQR